MKAANAEAAVVQAAAGSFQEFTDFKPLAVQTLERTEDYVKQQISNFGSYAPKSNKSVSPPHLHHFTSEEFAPLPTQIRDGTKAYVQQTPIVSSNSVKKKVTNKSN